MGACWRCELVGGNLDATITVQDGQTQPSLVNRFIARDTNNYLDCIALCPEGQKIAIGYCGGSIIVWNVQTVAMLQKMKHDTRSIDSVAWSPDGRFIAAGAMGIEAGVVRLRDAIKGTHVVEPVQGHREGVECVAFGHDLTFLVSGGHDGETVLWDLDEGCGHVSLRHMLRRHVYTVTCISVSPNDKYIVSASEDNTA